MEWTIFPTFPLPPALWPAHKGDCILQFQGVLLAIEVHTHTLPLVRRTVGKPKGVGG